MLFRGSGPAAADSTTSLGADLVSSADVLASRRKLQRSVEACVAGVQRRACLRIAGCDIVQHDNIVDMFRTLGRRVAGDGYFNRLDAALDMIEQSR